MKEYPSKTWISPRIEIRSSPVEGRGMFATAPIKAGEKVVVFGGVYTDEEGARKAQIDKKRCHTECCVAIRSSKKPAISQPCSPLLRPKWRLLPLWLRATGPLEAQKLTSY